MIYSLFRVFIDVGDLELLISEGLVDKLMGTRTWKVKSDKHAAFTNEWSVATSFRYLGVCV